MTRQGEGEDSVDVSKFVQDEVLEDVQLPATKVGCSETVQISCSVTLGAAALLR